VFRTDFVEDLMKYKQLICAIQLASNPSIDYNSNRLILATLMKRQIEGIDQPIVIMRNMFFQQQLSGRVREGEEKDNVLYQIVIRQINFK
jgi:hypothetical protein